MNSREGKSLGKVPSLGRSTVDKMSAGESPAARSTDDGDRFSTLWRHYGRGVLGLLIFVLLVHDVFGTHGFLAMRRTQAEISTVKANLARLNEENGRLAEHVHDLKSDPRTIEKLAREGSLLAKPGEVIIKIPQAQWFDQDSPQKP